MRRHLVGVTATPVTSRDSSQYRLKNPGNVPGRRDALCSGILGRASGGFSPSHGLDTPFFAPLPSPPPLFRLDRSFQIKADVAREKVKPGEGSAPRNGLNVESLIRMVDWTVCFLQNRVRGMGWKEIGDSS